MISYSLEKLANVSDHVENAFVRLSTGAKETGVV